MLNVPGNVVIKQEHSGNLVPSNKGFDGLQSIKEHLRLELQENGFNKFPNYPYGMGKEFNYQSQWGQDQVLLSWLSHINYGNNVTEQYFVDLAANHFATYSNSYVLERWFGWKGVCIEANPGYLYELSTKRKCQVVQAAVSENDDSIVNFHLDSGNGRIKDRVNSDNSIDTSDNGVGDEGSLHKFRTVKLDTILNYIQAPETIAFLSLDIEGGEYGALKNFDFNKYKFLTLAIERPSEAVHNILSRNGYFFMTKVSSMGDVFYVHRDVPDKYDPEGFFSKFLTWDRAEYLASKHNYGSQWLRQKHDYLFYPEWRSLRSIRYR